MDLMMMNLHQAHQRLWQTQTKHCTFLPCSLTFTRSMVHAPRFREEQLSAVFIRRCPACNRALVKTIGCAHVTCPCGTALCFVCNRRYEPKVSRTREGLSETGETEVYDAISVSFYSCEGGKAERFRKSKQDVFADLASSL